MNREIRLAVSQDGINLMIQLLSTSSNAQVSEIINQLMKEHKRLEDNPIGGTELKGPEFYVG